MAPSNPEKFVVIPAYLLKSHISDSSADYIGNAPEYQLKPEDFAYYSRTNMDQAAEIMGIKKYDVALPQNWVDNVCRLTGKNPCGHVVWSYDGEGSSNCFGKPVGITREGKLLLEIYDHVHSREL